MYGSHMDVSLSSLLSEINNNNKKIVFKNPIFLYSFSEPHIQKFIDWVFDKMVALFLRVDGQGELEPISHKSLNSKWMARLEACWGYQSCSAMKLWQWSWTQDIRESDP